MPGAPGKPGARDAGVLNYIDLALAGAYADLQDFYRRGGAISVSGPLSRFDRCLVAKVRLLLREIAITLTDRLGGDSDLYGWHRTQPQG